jgi:hypothetical protein
MSHQFLAFKPIIFLTWLRSFLKSFTKIDLYYIVAMEAPTDVMFPQGYKAKLYSVTSEKSTIKIDLTKREALPATRDPNYIEWRLLRDLRIWNYPSLKLTKWQSSLIIDEWG